MMLSPDGVLSADTFDWEPTPSRLLAALSEPIRLFITVAITFSIVGGILQILGSTRGPLARTVREAITLHVAGNLIASGIAIAVVLVVRRMSGTRHRISLGAAAAGGALGGAVRLPLEQLVSDGLELEGAVTSMMTEAGWFLIAAVVTNVTSRLARNENRTRASLTEALHRQSLLRTQLMNSDVTTRREVAEFLHGDCAAELMLIAEEARSMGPTGEALAARLGLLRDDKLRTFAHSLHPVLAELNLFGAVSDLALRYQTVTTVTVTADEVTLRGSLPPSVAVAAYRACEESIANAVKHGAARAIGITLTRDHPSYLTVVIEDDGAGKPDSLELGLGLTLIDTYVRAAGGTWKLEFGPTSGATVTVSVPLAGAPTSEAAAPA